MSLDYRGQFNKTLTLVTYNLDRCYYTLMHCKKSLTMIFDFVFVPIIEFLLCMLAKLTAQLVQCKLLLCFIESTPGSSVRSPVQLIAITSSSVIDLSLKKVIVSINNWFMLSVRNRVMDARGKFGEHERSARVARGVVESNSSFLSALQTSQVHP